MRLTLLTACALLIATGGTTFAQPPQGRSPQNGQRGGRPPRDDRPGGADMLQSSIARMMTLDADENGELSEEEVNDRRLQPLFRRADANQDGTVTREELQSMFETEMQNGQRGGRGPGPGGPGGMRGGPGGPPRPGQLLPPLAMEQLKLTDEQREQLEQLQQEVTQRLEEILNDQQKQQLQQILERGPMGPGGPGDPQGVGGPQGGGPQGNGQRGQRGRSPGLQRGGQRGR